MNRENEKHLYDSFEFYKPTDIRVGLMAFGFEHGDGWFNLIKKLSEDIQPLVTREFRVFQVKEKYGGLRYYAGGECISKEAAKQVDKLIREAERASYKICEQCGGTGRPNRHGWISTLCKPCRGLKLISGKWYFGENVKKLVKIGSRK